MLKPAIDRPSAGRTRHEGGVYRLGLLSNPNSGGNRTGLEAIDGVARAAGIPHHLTRDATAIETALRALAADGIEVLAINGGDGTLQAVLSVLRNREIFAREPAFALLRSGTTNMVHRDVGLDGPAHDALRRLAATSSGDTAARRIERRPVIVLHNGPHEPARYGFFFGAGAIPRAIRLARARLHPNGLTGPAGEVLALGWMTLRLLSGRVVQDPVLQPEDAAYALDTQGWQRVRMVFLLATTLNRLILGLRPTPSSGALGVVTLSWPYRRLWRALPAMLRPGLGTQDGLARATAHELSLRANGSCVLDGEIFAAAPTAPLRLRAAAPASFLVA